MMAIPQGLLFLTQLNIIYIFNRWRGGGILPILALFLNIVENFPPPPPLLAPCVAGANCHP